MRRILQSAWRPRIVRAPQFPRLASLSTGTRNFTSTLPRNAAIELETWKGLVHEYKTDKLFLKSFIKSLPVIPEKGVFANSDTSLQVN